MECTIDWLASSGMAFSAETGSGHLLTMDGAADGGGRTLAPRPMETVLAGTGACTAYDVVLILKRGRHDVRGMDWAPAGHLYLMDAGKTADHLLHVTPDGDSGWSATPAGYGSRST